jgi:hypothetical protein
MYFRIKEKDFPQKLETPNCTIITINTIEKYSQVYKDYPIPLSAAAYIYLSATAAVVYIPLLDCISSL